MAPAFKLRPWTEIVKLHPDVESGQTAVATYAIDLGALVSQDKSVPVVYRNTETFFRATHITPEIRRLIRDVIGALAGGTGDRVIQLRSPFGGGKSHTLATLYHAVRNPRIMRQYVDIGDAPNVDKAAVAVFDGVKFDALVGKEVEPGIHISTMWGWLGWQISKERNQPELFEIVRKHDELKVAPGGDVISQLLGDSPTLILLDEVLKYLVRASAVAIEGGNLQKQTVEFIDNLVREVAETKASPKATMVVYSLQASEREAMGNVVLLDMLRHLTSREEAVREPLGGDEILPVLKKRLLAEEPSAEMAREVANAYVSVIKNYRLAQAATDLQRRQADEETEALRSAIENAYPFHPALIDIMRERWASIPDYERTRGALRFLAVCLNRSKARKETSPILGPPDIPIQDGDVRQAFFSEVGQVEQFKAVLEADLIGRNARAKRIDARLQKENPRFASISPASRLATSILAFSFGGLQRGTGKDRETLPSGVTELELLESSLGPEDDSITAQVCLKGLREQCLYLHYDGARYAFKTTPNITMLVEEEAQNLDPDLDIKPFVRDELERKMAGQTNAIIFPASPQELPDDEPRFLIGYLPPEFAELSQGEQERRALDLLTQYNNRPRRYRNGLALAIPNRGQLDPLRHAARYLMAIQRVEQKKKQALVTKEQEFELDERRKTEKAGLESSLRALYSNFWLLSSDVNAPMEKLETTGRPLQAMEVHARTMEFLMQVARRVHGTLAPKRIVELFHLGEPVNGSVQIRKGVSTKSVVDAFFGSPGFPRLLNSEVISSSISTGVAGPQPLFGFYGQGEIQVGNDGKYQVARDRVSFGVSLRTDEIDLETGFLIHPDGIPSAGSAPSPDEGMGSNVGTGHVFGTPESGEAGITNPQMTELSVSYTLQLNRDQLFKAYDALANLADIVGNLDVRVNGKAVKKIDRSQLRNAVEEPLEELGVLKEKS